MSQNNELNKKWLRMRFKKSRVWVLCNERGEPVVENGRAIIKYDLLQSQAYLPLYSNLSKLKGKQELVDDPGKTTRIQGNKPMPFANVKSQEPSRMDDAIVIYTDGASSKNPGPAGVGVVLKYKGKKKEISRYLGEATNNVAELMAVKVALEQVKTKDIPIVLYTDSTYVHGLLAKGWKAHQNQELVETIREMIKNFKVLYLVKVKGHGGVEENEQADHLARMAVKTQKDSESVFYINK